jgi:hypothetical protein
MGGVFQRGNVLGRGRTLAESIRDAQFATAA